MANWPSPEPRVMAAAGGVSPAVFYVAGDCGLAASAVCIIKICAGMTI